MVDHTTIPPAQPYSSETLYFRSNVPANEQGSSALCSFDLQPASNNATVAAADADAQARHAAFARVRPGVDLSDIRVADDGATERLQVRPHIQLDLCLPRILMDFFVLHFLCAETSPFC